MRKTYIVAPHNSEERETIVANCRKMIGSFLMMFSNTCQFSDSMLPRMCIRNSISLLSSTIMSEVSVIVDGLYIASLFYRMVYDGD